MNTANDIYVKVENTVGDEYYCPIDALQDTQYVSEWESENCVEATTAGRYSGNLNVMDRFDS